MALQCTKTLDSGFDANYWQIYDLQLDKLDDRVICNIRLFKDHDARLAEKNPVYQTTYVWAGVDNPCTMDAMDAANSDPWKLCYDKLKTLPEFSGATGV